MKKIMALLMIVSLGLLSGCTLLGTGEYKEGTYFGTDEDSGYTAAVYIDSKGKVASVLIDAGYTKDCSIVTDEDGEESAKCSGTTKRTLGADYGMTNVGAEFEWYEQADRFAEKVVEEQGLDWVDWRYKDSEGEIVSTQPVNQTEDDMKYIDSVSGVTIHVNEMYNAVNAALKLAE